MKGHYLRGSHVELFHVPCAYRHAFLNGKSVAPSQPRTVGRDRSVTSAVVAPPKQSKELPTFEAWSTGAKIKKRTDIKTILILGPGPIIIGQVEPFVTFAGPNQGSESRC